MVIQAIRLDHVEMKTLESSVEFNRLGTAPLGGGGPHKRISGSSIAKVIRDYVPKAEELKKTS